jgi:hypothetical protein
LRAVVGPLRHPEPGPASFRREPVEEIGRHRAGMSRLSDPTDEQWELLDPVFNAPGKGGGKHADDVRGVVDAML